MKITIDITVEEFVKAFSKSNSHIVAPNIEAAQKIFDLIKAGQFINAIKLHRRTYNTSLLDAKNACDVIKDRL